MFAVLGRVCFSIVFIIAGVNKILNWEPSQQYLIESIEVLSKVYTQPWAVTLLSNMHAMAHTLLLAAVVIELGAGILIFIGIGVRFAAVLISLFLIGATLLFHEFWLFEGMDKQIQMIMLLKNLSIFGGALTLIAFGKGHKRVSVV